MKEPSFDPGSLVEVTTEQDIKNLSTTTEGVFVFELTDDKLCAIALHLPNLRYLIADGNTRVTDRGLDHLKRFSMLETLDLEWSNVSNAGLPMIAAIQSLRWVDLGFCKGITQEAASELQRVRPDLKAIFAWI